MSEVVQGILNVPGDIISKKPEKDQLPILKRLVIHECLRVFSDRLINQTDKQIFIDQGLALKPKSNQNKSFITLEDVGTPRDLLFCNFVEFNPVDPVY